MENKKLKKIMTDLAAGHITQKEADNLIKPKKAHQEGPKQAKRPSQKKTHNKLNDKIKKNE